MSTTTGHGLRLTPQRRAVLDVLQRATDHPTAAEVHARVQALQPGVGSATVYRSLALLVSEGLALELSLNEGGARYDANTTRHDHLVCEWCGRAVDVQAPLPPTFVDAAAEGSGFTVRSYDLQIRGLCPACRVDDAVSAEPGHQQRRP